MVELLLMLVGSWVVVVVDVVIGGAAVGGVASVVHGVVVGGDVAIRGASSVLNPNKTTNLVWGEVCGGLFRKQVTDIFETFAKAL
eukprot:m.30036 g.30036  ORF g.30036 m.30036 type:complete len:85 (-) comp16202_c0_seq1:2000-2254(-)